MELAIGAGVEKSSNDGGTIWSKKFKDRFSPLDTIPAVTDGRTDGQVAVAKTAHAMRRVLARVKKVVLVWPGAAHAPIAV